MSENNIIEAIKESVRTRVTVSVSAPDVWEAFNYITLIAFNVYFEDSKEGLVVFGLTDDDKAFFRILISKE